MLLFRPLFLGCEDFQSTRPKLRSNFPSHGVDFGYIRLDSLDLLSIVVHSRHYVFSPAQHWKRCIFSPGKGNPTT